MYDFKIEAADKATLYRDLASALEGLVAGEPDADRQHGQCRGADLGNACPTSIGPASIATSAASWCSGPFQGRPACIRIPFGKGVCGAAAQTRQVQRVDDVHAFDGHIACDSASNSEIVVPIVRDGELLGVLDIDSPKHGAVRPKRTRPAASSSPRSCAKASSSAVSSRSSLERPGDDHHRAGQLARVVAA